MDSEDSSKSISKGGGTSISEEFVHGPLHSDSEHESITGNDIEVATRVHPELETVDDTFVSVFTAATGSSWLTPGLSVVIPVVGVDQLHGRVSNRVGTSVGVVDGHLESALALFSSQVESLLVGRSSSVLNDDVSVHVNHGGESLLTFLASVESVPTVIHVGVQTVIVTSVVSNVNWLRGTVHSVTIKTVEDQNSDSFVLANPGVPGLLEIASRHNFGGNRLKVVGNNFEILRNTESESISNDLGVSETSNGVVKSSTGENTTISRVGP